jgi:hypothetical protein
MTTRLQADLDIGYTRARRGKRQGLRITLPRKQRSAAPILHASGDTASWTIARVRRRAGR